MSTHWDIHCKDCNVDFDLDVNHGDQDMRDIIEHRALWEALAKIDQVDSVIWHGDRMWDRPIMHRMFAAHAGHRLVARNEYGDELGQCLHRMACECGRGMRCRLPVGHDGEHDGGKQ